MTVLEEAHNLLKNTNGSESELIGKSVEMLTNTIAEIRTYGEGFIIVDQSPSSVDIAAIKIRIQKLSSVHQKRMIEKPWDVRLGCRMIRQTR